MQHLSRGMQQRLCLAHTLVHDPPLLLLDEPASGLDPRARVELRDILRTLRDMGKTILVSSHILSELAEIATEIGIMHRGRLLISGPVDQIRQQYADQRIIQLRVAHDVQPAIDALQALIQHPELADEHAHGLVIDHISEDPEHPTRLRLVCEGLTDAQQAALLAWLLQRGVVLCDYHLHLEHLEQVFLRLTEAEA